MTLNSQTGETILHQTGGFTLSEKGENLFLYSGTRVYSITSTPFEPCTFLKLDEHILSTIHNAFDCREILSLAQEGGTLHAVTGCEYDLPRLCRMLAYAAANPGDYSIEYVEGKLAIEDMKQRGAISPETAVSLASLGIRHISRAFSHSRRLQERVMTTDDNRVYLQIKKP